MKNNDKKIKKGNNPLLENSIMSQAKDGKITCIEAMQIATELGESTSAVGRMLDQMRIRLTQCQLGLFGHVKPHDKVIQAAEEVSPELEEEIRKALKNDRLPCITAWSIAQEKKIHKMTVSAACDSLKIKIKPCQLGAF